MDVNAWRRWSWGVVGLAVLLGLVFALGDAALAGKPEKPPKPDPDPDPPTLSYAIMYGKDGNLYRITTDGLEKETIMRRVGSAWWVPDGSAVIVKEGTSYSLVQPDWSDYGSSSTYLGEFGNSQAFRYWAPGGRRVFHVWQGDTWGLTDLFVYDLETGEKQFLGLNDTFNSTIEGGATTPDLDASLPGWQGWFIFVARHLDHDPYDEDQYTDYDLWTVWMEETFDAEGKSRFVVDLDTLWQYWMDGEQNGPLLSPDGKTLIFTTEWENKTHVAPFDLETGRIGPSSILLRGGATLLQGQGLGTWSPDGRWFATLADGGLVIVRPDGSDKRLLTSFLPKYGYSPSWDPNWVNDLD